MYSLIFFTLAFALIPNIAHAYIDPGSASLFMTLIVGVLAGLAVTIRIYWRKLKIIFENLFQWVRPNKNKKDNN